MVRLVIRDDDTNFFTKVSDLEFVYKPISFFPISYAVIPTVMDVSTIGACLDTKGNSIPRYVGDNTDLVSYLSELAFQKKCDLLLHGIQHHYKIIDGKKMAEMEWRRSDVNLDFEISKWKIELSSLFNYSINCFVAPSNKITKEGIKAIYRCKMNFSGIIPISFEHDMNLKSVRNYTKRMMFRLKSDMPYPGILDYGTHLEMNACTMPSLTYLKLLFEYCCKLDCPMAINVHYWYLRDNVKVRDSLFEFVEYAINRGAVPSTMRECFDSYMVK